MSELPARWSKCPRCTAPPAPSPPPPPPDLYLCPHRPRAPTPTHHDPHHPALHRVNPPHLASRRLRLRLRLRPRLRLRLASPRLLRRADTCPLLPFAPAAPRARWPTPARLRRAAPASGAREVCAAPAAARPPVSFPTPIGTLAAMGPPAAPRAPNVKIRARSPSWVGDAHREHAIWRRLTIARGAKRAR